MGTKDRRERQSLALDSPRLGARRDAEGQSVGNGGGAGCPHSNQSRGALPTYTCWLQFPGQPRSRPGPRGPAEVGAGAGFVTWRSARRRAGRGRALGSLKAREPSRERRLRGRRRRPGPTSETRGAPARGSSESQHAPVGLAGAGRVALAR